MTEAHLSREIAHPDNVEKEGRPVEKRGVARDERDEMAVWMLNSSGAGESKGFARDERDAGRSHEESGRHSSLPAKIERKERGGPLSESS
jgi:hypothetical protein